MKLWDFTECFMLFGAGDVHHDSERRDIRAGSAADNNRYRRRAADCRDGGDYRLLRGAQAQRYGMLEGV